MIIEMQHESFLMKHDSFYPDTHEIIGTVVAECRPLVDWPSHDRPMDYEVNVIGFTPGNVFADLRCYHGAEAQWLARKLAALCKNKDMWKDWLLKNCERVIELYIEKSGEQQP